MSRTPQRRRTGSAPATPARSSRSMSVAGLSDISYTSSVPATSVIDSNRQVGILVGKGKKKKLSKRSKNIRKKKVKFQKKVSKALVKLGAVNTYKEFCLGEFNLDGYAVGGTNWDTRMEQTFTWSVLANEANEGRGFWYGGKNASGNDRTQDMFQLLNYQNNELFLSQAQSGTGAYNNTLATLTTANVQCMSVGAEGLKVWIKSVKYTMSLRNRISTKAVCVDVYELVAKRNFSPDSPYRNSRLAYEKCIADNTFTGQPGVTSKVTLDDPQATPADIPGFSDYWKTKSATRLFLQPGETKMITFYGAKGWYDGKKFSSLYAIGGKTTEFLFIVGGGQCPGLTNTDLFPAVKWSKQINYRNQQGFGKPKNLVLSNSQII